MGCRFFPDRHSCHDAGILTLLPWFEALYGLRIPRKTLPPSCAPTCFRTVSHPSKFLCWPCNLCTRTSSKRSHRLAVLALSHLNGGFSDALYNPGRHAGGDLDRHAAISRFVWGHHGGCR